MILDRDEDVDDELLVSERLAFYAHFCNARARQKALRGTKNCHCARGKIMRSDAAVPGGEANLTNKMRARLDPAHSVLLGNGPLASSHQQRGMVLLDVITGDGEGIFEIARSWQQFSFHTY